jgi:hypothetical protein
MSDATLVSRCTLGNLSCPIPDAVHPSVDLVRMWTRRRPSAYDLDGFNRRFVHIDRPHPQARFPIWLINFAQPDADALAAIDRRHHWALCYTEFALDWIYRDAERRLAATAFFDRHFVHPRHRDAVRLVGDTTRYTRNRFTPGGRLTRTNVVAYPDQCSNVTGEPCLHIERRIASASALRSAGIQRAADLLRFDHRAFWQQHLLFYDLDSARFGRALINWRRGWRRRNPWIRRFGDGRRYDVYTLVGGLCFLASGSIQMLLHHCAEHTTLNARDYLIQMPTPDCLLPADTLPMIECTHCPRTLAHIAPER